MLREKREVVILLFLFYRNTGVEGGRKWSFYQKKMPGYIRFFSLSLERVLLQYLLEGNIFFCFSTKYIVGEETITIRSGFVKKRILIRDIKQILNTKNPIAAHALSFDRLEIVYGAHQTEIISPKDKEQFINLVTSKNPHIEIK